MMTLRELMATFPTDDDCKQFLMHRRWPNGVQCPRCGNDKVYESKSRPFHWQCRKCSNQKHPYRFSVLVGTVFENTNYALKTWFEVLWTMLNSKKGISALQIHRQIGSGSYRTAWYMCHRLRSGMQDNEFQKLMGIVEVDETYVGGKNKNRHADKRKDGRGTAGKVAVIGAIARKGNVVAQVIEKVDQKTLTNFVEETVSDKVSLVATDEHAGYAKLTKKGFSHEAVNHSEGEYVRGNIHTQNIDSFWSLLKRGIIGSFHHVSKEYLPLYINEFVFRYNNRENPDIFGTAIASC